MAVDGTITPLGLAAKDDDTALQFSPPASTSPASLSKPTARPVANRAATPLGLFLDGSVPPTSPRRGKGGAGTGMAPTTSHHDDLDPFATMSPAETPDHTDVSPAPVHADGGVDGVVDVEPCLHREPQQKSMDVSIPTNLTSSATSPPGPRARTKTGPLLDDDTFAAEAQPQNSTSQMTKSTPPPDLNTEPSSPVDDENRPLRTASVRADTKIVHPKPISHPPAMAHAHAAPDNLILSGSAAGNIAQLEATAERLSMTSSIDDAIRDLHGELKRSDSRRSAKLGLSTMASVDENMASPPHVGRHLSATSSIVSTNIAARHGGYSPAGFVMSPNTSLTSRLRSGSTNSAVVPDAVPEMFPCRNGPGKSSVRSVRSAKMSLAEISESEPVNLNQEAFDRADAAPPLDEQSNQSLQLPEQPVSSHDTAQQSLEDPMSPPLDSQHGLRASHYDQAALSEEHGHIQRPESVHSDNTSEQARDAFIDFDGVHWEPRDEEEQDEPAEVDQGLPTPRPAPISMARPKSFIDPSTGQKMLYYPARVPAMLKLPPKLSSKPKATARNDRRSQVLSMMMDLNNQGPATSPRRSGHFSTLAGLKDSTPEPETAMRDSWLPDPVASHRDSFAALSTFALDEIESKPGTGEVQHQNEGPEPLAAEQDANTAALRRPERLSKALKDNRKSKASMLSHLPSQLRASAFFDLPSQDAPEVEIKDGSAMATLDSILDASASAPVRAFTDHVFAGKLGSETYGKTKKKSRQSTATLSALAPESQPKKKSSMMRLVKRSSSYNSDEQRGTASNVGVVSIGEDDGARSRDGRLTPGSVNSAARDAEHGAEDDDDVEDEDGEEFEEDMYQGQPVTLLAELQLRKQEQKHRVRNMGKGLPNGMYATLLDMDAVAEAQRKNRQNKRVNLAWEDPEAHLDQNGSDDEDVPLAVIAAMQRGAKNLADLDRPMGLMERREREDNEPLSHRRARLQGLEVPAPAILVNNRQSVMSFPAAQAFDNQSQHPETVPTPEPEVEEIEEETLGERRLRLTTKEGELPTTRPVSVAFSAELLSQFGDLEEKKEKKKEEGEAKKDDKKGSPAPEVPAEDETLGQRRRRLQAEREAREREISYGNLVGDNPSGQDHRRRLSLANVLSAHPRRDADGNRTHFERIRMEEEQRAAREQDAKMAAMRKQMPTSLPQIGVERSGGFLGGAFNDGTGGQGPRAALPNVHSMGFSSGHRASVMTGYGVPVAQPLYGPTTTYGNGYGGQNTMGAYNGMYNGRPASQVYAGGGMMPMQAPAPTMDRVEQWRYGVRP